MGVQNHDVILLFLLGMVLLTLNPMEVKINLRYEEENLHGKSREGRKTNHSCALLKIAVNSRTVSAICASPVIVGTPSPSCGS